jgi:type II secretory pathway pseudopilin PulG
LLTPTLREEARRDDGLGLVELLVVVLVLGVIGAMTITSLVRGMRTTDRVEARIQASTDLQRAAERVARDLRRGVWTDISLTPLPSPPAGCTYVSLDGDELTLIVFDGIERFRHTYTHVDGTLTLDVDRWSSGAWADVSTTTVIDGLQNATAGEDVFSFLDRNGGDLLEDGLDPTDHADVRNFRLTLVGTVRDQPAMTLNTTVAARNGGIPCPVAS